MADKTPQNGPANSLTYVNDPNRSPELKLRDSIAALCVKQAQAGLKFKEVRVNAWNDNIDLYAGTQQKDLQSGRFDYPLPIMSGFVDTGVSKLDQAPEIEFDHLSLADKKRAKKVSAAWRFYSSAEEADWETIDLDVRKIAFFTGVGIYKTYCESDPEFKHYLEAVDPFDYIAEPLGGADLKRHSFGFQDNIFRSQYDLENGAQYNQDQVAQLKAAANDKNFKLNTFKDRAKLNRFRAMGLRYDSATDYLGEKLYRLTEGFTRYNGEKWYVFMDLESGIWLRIEKLKDVFKSNKPPFVAWQTHRDAFNFWSKAPCDDVRPVAQATRRVFNEAMYNINKRNSGQRAYDPEMFDDPDLLNWRPDGLVPATVPVGKQIASGVYEFKTEDNTAITVNLIRFLDAFTGQKTGITPSSQGQTPTGTKVGVYFGDLQQVADRLGLTNKYYARAWRELGNLFAWGLWEHMTEKLLVKVIGEDGVEWTEVTKEDANPDFAVIVRGGNAEQQANKLKEQSKTTALTAVATNPLYSRLLNPRLVVEEMLTNAGWDQEAVKRLMDITYMGDEDSLVAAAQAIQDILEGKEPRLYRKATLAFLQYIENFLNTKEIRVDQEVRMFHYFSEMKPIVVRNMTRRALFGGPMLSLPNSFPSVMGPGQGGNMVPGGNPPVNPVNPNPTVPANPAPTVPGQ